MLRDVVRGIRRDAQKQIIRLILFIEGTLNGSELRAQKRAYIGALGVYESHYQYFSSDIGEPKAMPRLIGESEIGDGFFHNSATDLTFLWRNGKMRARAAWNGRGEQ